MTTEERNALVLRNVPWVKAVVVECRRRYPGMRRTEFEEHMQESLAYLLEHVGEWDQSRGSLTNFIWLVVWQHLVDYCFRDRTVASYPPHRGDSEARKRARERTDPGQMVRTDLFRDEEGDPQHPVVWDDRHGVEARDVLRLLSPVHRRVLELHFGIGDGPYSDREVGQALGVSGSRVQQRRYEATARLKRYAA